jgi:superfamily II RNA helicase
VARFLNSLIADADAQAQARDRKYAVSVEDICAVLEAKSLSPALLFSFSIGDCIVTFNRLLVYVYQENKKKKKVMTPRVSEEVKAILEQTNDPSWRTEMGKAWVEEQILDFYEGLKPTCRVALHHAKMPSTARSVVERLLALGYFRFVAATTSLAEGIHTPCKAVVFHKDSRYLDSVVFLQGSGRAGPRGIEDRGYSITANISPSLQRVEQFHYLCAAGDSRSHYDLGAVAHGRASQVPKVPSDSSGVRARKREGATHAADTPIHQ